jgi:hypothetical protein
MSSSLGVFTDSQAGSFDRCEFDGLTLYSCIVDLRLYVAGNFEGIEDCTLFYSLWTVGLEDGLVLFFDGLEMR